MRLELDRGWVAAMMMIPMMGVHTQTGKDVRETKFSPRLPSFFSRLQVTVCFTVCLLSWTNDAMSRSAAGGVSGPHP